ncbi:nuclear transport factor 2 family protein [Natronoarchaeum sp. GCM10025703]|uniref:nuclear transport factor 2 family protein n=1 Tax=Natronoarchaeum sp. GCM10025703 TaxID=3252685 RepID=UPI003618FA71
MADAEPLVRAFYTALDEHNYDDLASLIASDFIHYRPDRTFEGRTAFVSFMRDGRPMTDTAHELERVFLHADGAAVQGQLLDSERRGALWLRRRPYRFGRADYERPNLHAEPLR